MSFTFTTKIKKYEFELYLFELNNEQIMNHSTFIENGVTLHLYYNDWGHIGTWQSPGYGCVFEKIINATSEDDFQLKGSRVFKKNDVLNYQPSS